LPNFLDPFVGVVPDRKLTDRELARALRLSLAAEEEAIHLYEALADATTNELAREVLQDIANEEKVHAGEFQRLLNILYEDETKWLEEGAQEVNEMAGLEEEETKEKSSMTIGSLRE
jgi:rubrerythrin